MKGWIPTEAEDGVVGLCQIVYVSILRVLYYCLLEKRQYLFLHFLEITWFCLLRIGEVELIACYARHEMQMTVRGLESREHHTYSCASSCLLHSWCEYLRRREYR